MYDKGTLENIELYDKIWEQIPVQDYKKLPTWDILKNYVKPESRLLEIGPGVRPCLPIDQTIFLDISKEAVDKLNEIRQDCAYVGSPEDMPFSEDSFDIICALDVLEHIVHDQEALGDVSRTLKDDGTFFFTVPLHQEKFNQFDKEAGHQRRYEPSELIEKLNNVGLHIVGISKYGTRPKSRFLNNIGAFIVRNFPVFSIKIRTLIMPNLRIFRRPLKPIYENPEKYLDLFEDILVIAKKAPQGNN